jgi:hypothetical protein
VKGKLYGEELFVTYTGKNNNNFLPCTTGMKYIIPLAFLLLICKFKKNWQRNLPLQ